MKKRISDEQFLEISSSVEDYSKVFYTFIELSDIYLTDEISTASIMFSKYSKPVLNIGESFWESLNLREKIFVICHECLHVILDHGFQSCSHIKGATPDLINIAQDITINEMIVYLFGFNRNDIRDWKKYCWIDTCFKDPSKIKKNETFLYYLNELIKDPPPENDGSGSGPQTLDQHSDPGAGGSGAPSSEAKDSIAQTLAEDLTAKEIEQIIDVLGAKDSTGAGTSSGFLEHLLEIKTQKQRLNFLMMIRKLKKTALKEVDTDVETFTHDDRRFSDILTRKDIALPGKKAIGKPSKDRLLTAIFMDVSGSCIEHVPFFAKIAKAFDDEKQYFDVTLHTFDTSVKRISWGDRPRIGGGTCFSIIEAECLKLESEFKRYPDCVIVITDGDGNAVKPKAPSKWIWLLTPNAMHRYIPRESKHYFIDDVIL